MSSSAAAAAAAAATASTAQQWDNAHSSAPGNAPSRLYTDENPATTIKGCGFKNKRIAQRTVELMSQQGVRYKQYWTIRAMRERAAHHPHPTVDMQEAIAVFDAWLERYEEPTAEEKKMQHEEWQTFKRLCASDGNKHRYGTDPSKEELRRARDDLSHGQTLLMELLSPSSWVYDVDSNNGKQRKKSQADNMQFRLTSFVALFGGPGLHGYGKHIINPDQSTSKINICSVESVEELLGRSRTLKLGLSDPVEISIAYDRKLEMAAATIEQRLSTPTLSTLWAKQAVKGDEDVIASKGASGSEEPAWTCSSCTFVHNGAEKNNFLACEMCGSQRTDGSSSAFDTKPVQPTSWGTLRPPSKRDIAGSRKRRKGLDKPPPMLDYLVVLDFEWTADNKRKMEPVAEITQFPSVLLKLSEDATKLKETADEHSACSNCTTAIPHDLRRSAAESSYTNKRDAWCISIFDTFVKPTLNPILTEFSISLTGITQDNVNGAPTIEHALAMYMTWLYSLGLVDEHGHRKGNWAFATWGDCDLMSTLRLELKNKSIDLPPCFDRWINLKDNAIYQKHYHREPRGGLRACVESVGAKWEGRAHNGLVDSINTAKIVRHIYGSDWVSLYQNHQRLRFKRRAFWCKILDKDGVPFGAKAMQSEVK